MKKVLLTTLAIAIAMAGFAQKGQERVKAEQPRSAKANVTAMGKFDVAPTTLDFTPSTSVPRNVKGDDYVGWQTMLTRYDLQTNKMVGNRMYRFEDGTLGLTATWSQQSTNADRGTGYDYYDGTTFLFEEDNDELPPVTARIESMRTGWPSYCQYGTKGEFLVSHTGSSLIYYTRENKGEGEWIGPNEIPNPDWLGTPAYEMTWPRVATSGPNHNIIHIVSADNDDDSNTYLYYNRSTDGENWTTTLIPTLEDWEQNLYSADTYCVAANGNNVAILLVSVYGHGYVIKSTDNGETWTKIKFWDNPYAQYDWATDENSLFGGDYDDIDQYGPEIGNITIDNNGIVHGVFAAHKYAHDELGTGYTYYYGRTCDGVFYWNETMGTLQGPEWVCPDDGTVIPSDPHNVFRMWWPTDASGEYITRNWESANLIGFITPDEHFADINTDQMCVSNYFQNCSTSPAICVDDNGTVGIAYSVMDASRELSTNGYYYRSIVVAFIEPGYVMGDATGDYTDIPGNCYYEYVKLQDADDFLHSYDEAIYPFCSPNTTDREFWFAYQADDYPGLYSSSSGTQTQPTDNYIWAQKVVPDYPDVNVSEHTAVNPMTATRVYPNPATNVLNIEVNASQASEMSISVFNIMGQNVMNQTVSINTGMNTRPVNISELNSGIYFVTVKANGFENTMKFIVK